MEEERMSSGRGRGGCRVEEGEGRKEHTIVKDAGSDEHLGRQILLGTRRSCPKTLRS